MNDGTISLLITLALSVIITGSLTLLVWLRYPQYSAMVKKIGQFRIFNIWPFAKSIRAWEKTTEYKWFVRVIAPLVFIILTGLLVGVVISSNS